MKTRITKQGLRDLNPKGRNGNQSRGTITQTCAHILDDVYEPYGYDQTFWYRFCGFCGFTTEGRIV